MFTVRCNFCLRKVFLVTVLYFVVCALFAQGGKAITFYSEAVKDIPLQYLFYKSGNTAVKQPLLVYLHGVKSKGGKLDQVKLSVLPKLLEEGRTFPFHVAAPHLPANKDWSPEFIELFIRNITTQYAIDPDRVYLLGVDIGAAGAFNYTCAHPEKIACVVAVSGWSNPALLCKMKVVPAWIFHAQDDDVVNVKGSQNAARTLYNCGGSVIYTELPEGKHDIALKVYNHPDLFEWMLAKNKSAKSSTISRIQFDAITVGYKLPKAMDNITGIWASDTGAIYGISEKTLRPVIICFDTLAHISKMITVQKAANWSWQDITPIGNHELIIADVGNDNFKRESFQLYRVSENDFGKELITSSKVEFTVPFGKPLTFKSVFYADSTAFLFGRDADNDVFLVSVPLNQGEKVEASLVKNCNALMPDFITSAYYHSGQGTLYLLSKNVVGIFPVKNDFQNLTKETAIYLPLTHNTQKEALTILPNGYLAFADRIFYGIRDGNLYLRRYP